MIELYQSLQQKKLVEVNNLSGSQSYVNKNIRFKNPVLRSDLCDYSERDYISLGCWEQCCDTKKKCI